MSSTYKNLINAVKKNQNTMVDQVYQFCTINSGTSNLPGLEKMSQALQSAFKSVSDSIETIPLEPFSHIDISGDHVMQTCGDALFIRKRAHLKRRVLLCGHMDTVYGENHPFQKLKLINENCLNGPGVTDMKGGLIAMLHALSAFELHESASELGWDVLINADEEIGSPASSVFLDTIANNYQTALVYEPAMTSQGTLAKNRKGSGKITLIASGKSAHAGRNFNEGRNAICYLAEAISAVNSLNSKREGVTINVGKIAGGDALNVVPEKAVAQLDIRISLPEDEYWVRDELNKIVSQLRRQDYSLSVQGLFGRPVKRICSGTERLFQRIQCLGKELGISLEWKDSGGCCDGNNIAQHHIPVLDTLGVRGGNIHSAEEYILLDSLSERAALSALLLVDLAQGGLEELKNDAISKCA